MTSAQLLDAERKRANQLAVNTKWLVEQFDKLHDILCPEHMGTWQQRVVKVVEVVEAMKKVEGKENAKPTDM